MAWRYFAHRLNGDGTETLLNPSLALDDVEMTLRDSGANSIDFKIKPELAHMRGDDGWPIFDPWSTAIYAEQDGVLRSGFIVNEVIAEGPSLSVGGVGFIGYLIDMPFDGEWRAPGDGTIDPANAFRQIISHVQSRTRSNVGLTVDQVSTPLRVGEAEKSHIENKKKVVDEQAKPYTLSWYGNYDLFDEVNKLAKGSFAYQEEHWVEGGKIRHHIRLGWPTLGRRYPGRFVEGENIIVSPATEWGEDYSTEVIVVGAGEGSTTVRSRIAPRYTRRLRRPVVVQAKSVTTAALANSLAEVELAARQVPTSVDEVILMQHPNADIGSLRPGDEILIQLRGGWMRSTSVWVRITGVTISPEKIDIVRLSVQGAERITSDG